MVILFFFMPFLKINIMTRKLKIIVTTALSGSQCRPILNLPSMINQFCFVSTMKCHLKIAKLRIHFTNYSGWDEANNKSLGQTPFIEKKNKKIKCLCYIFMTEDLSYHIIINWLKKYDKNFFFVKLESVVTERSWINFWNY